MMKFDLEGALKFPFKDPNWTMKLGPIIGINVLFSLFSLAFQFIPYLSEGNSVTGDFVGVLAVFGLLGMTLLMIPYFIYISGYVVELMSNVMKGDETPLPEHKDFGKKLSLFGASLVIGIGPGLLAMVIIFALFIPGIVFLASFGDPVNPGASMLLVLGILYLIFASLLGFAVLLALSWVVAPSMLYIYLKTGSLGKAFDYATVRKVVMVSWKPLLLAGLITIAISIGLTMLTYASWLCLLGWLVGPAAQIWMMISQSHLLGQVFKDLNSQKVIA